MESLLYNDNKTKLKDAVKSIVDPAILHIIAFNYNWDDGFDIPYLIINNKNCDIGTALMLFFYADGYVLFNSKSKEDTYSSKE